MEFHRDYFKSNKTHDMIYDFSKTPSVFNEYIKEIRDEKVQVDSMRFRRNLERIGELMAYEISKTFDYGKVEVKTPLGLAELEEMKDTPVLATILRAGLAMHQGFVNVFDRADSAFVSAYRKHSKSNKFEVYVQYMAVPNIDGKVLIISDPMLATGSSMLAVYQELLLLGKPKKVIMCVAIAAQEAIDYLEENSKGEYELYVGAIDKELTAQAYIVPGLGDAGDLAYGKKNNHELD